LRRCHFFAAISRTGSAGANAAHVGDSEGGLGAMNPHSRTTSISSIGGPRVVRRSSVSSRLSVAVSTAEQGEGQTDNGRGIAVQHQIEEEIAKIKRYEVGGLAPPAASWKAVRSSN